MSAMVRSSGRIVTPDLWSVFLLVKHLLYRFSPDVLRSIYQRIEASPLGYRLAKGAFWSLAGSLISRGLGLVSGILVGRFLGKASFGELGMIQSTVGMFGAVAGFGMGMMATRYVAELRLKDPLRAGRIIALSSATTWISSGVLALVLVIFAPWLAEHTLAAPKLAGLLRIGSLLLLLGGINSAQTGALSGFEAFKAISRINLITGVLSFPMMVFGAWFWGVTGAVWGLIGNYAVNSWLNWNTLRQEARKSGISINYADCWSERVVFWKFNVPSILNSIMFSFSAWACGAILVHQIGGYGGMGLFNAANRVRAVPELLVGMLIAPLLPVLSETFGRKDMDQYGKTLIFTYTLGTLIIVPLALVQVAAPWVTLLPYGTDYQGGDSVVRWLMAGSIAYSLVLPMGSILVSMGRMWLAFFLVVFYISLYFGLGWLLIPHYGAAGYAAAWTIAFVVGNVFCVIFLYLKLGRVMRRIQWLRMALVTCALLLICWFVSNSASKTVAIMLGLFGALSFCVWRLLACRKDFRVDRRDVKFCE